MSCIAIVQGHPDSGVAHYGHALAEAYAAGAAAGGHEVRRIDVAALGIPPLHSKAEWDQAPPGEGPIREAQDLLAWADHLLIVYPLWLGEMPALLKGFLEQVSRNGFGSGRGLMQKPWRGKSARLVVTMGMPALAYRWYFGAHGVRALKRSILGFAGVAPVRTSLIGMIEARDGRRRGKWLEKLHRLGRGAC